MEPSGRVADNDVRAARLGRRDGVKDDRRRVCALVLPDDIHMCALRPDLELIRRRRAERVRRAEEYLLALTAALICDLADGRGLANAVDADHQHHGRPRIEPQRRITDVQHLREDLTQAGAGVLRRFQAA